MAFDNIKLEKGLYTTGKSFTQALEELDPSENYAGTSLEGLDAYERQLKRFDIKVSGKDSDTVSKFFATTDASALFPEYISRAVALGIETNNTVDKIVATTTEIDALDYRSINCTETNFELDEVEEGNSIPELSISLNSKLTTLKKHGKMLVASYEAIKYQKLDLFTTMLKKIGDSIANSEFLQACLTLSDPGNVTNLSDKGVTFNNLIDFWVGLMPYKMDAMVVSKKNFAKILAMTEFNDSYAGINFNVTGNPSTPFGVNLYCGDGVSDAAILGLDSNYALEKVQAGGVLTEFDKLIDRQLERATISTITGFSTIYDDASSIITFAQS